MNKKALLVFLLMYDDISLIDVLYGKVVGQ